MPHGETRADQSAVRPCNNVDQLFAAERLAQDRDVLIIVELRDTFCQAKIGVAEAGGEDDLHRYAGQQDFVQHVDPVLLRDDHVEHEDIGFGSNEDLGGLQ
jgi:hypothetical protein